jgi:hypothetical protein
VAPDLAARGTARSVLAGNREIAGWMRSAGAARTASWTTARSALVVLVMSPDPDLECVPFVSPRAPLAVEGRAGLSSPPARLRFS